MKNPETSALETENGNETTRLKERKEQCCEYEIQKSCLGLDKFDHRSKNIQISNFSNFDQDR